MNLKVKTVKKPKQFPYQVYGAKIGNHKFEANLFEDDGGMLTGRIGNDFFISREDAKLEDWIDEAQEMSAFYHNLVDFLKEVEYTRRNQK